MCGDFNAGVEVDCIITRGPDYHKCVCRDGFEPSADNNKTCVPKG